MRAKTKVISLALLAGSLLLTACGHRQTGGLSKTQLQFKQTVPKKEIRNGGTLTEALEMDTPFTGIFAPELADTTADAEVAAPGQESLFFIDDHYRINNKGPASLQLNVRQKTAKITVKKGVRWSDGQQVNAKDVEYAYEILANKGSKSPYFSTDLENIKGLKAYHEGQSKSIAGIAMPAGAKGRTIILHFKTMKPGMKQYGNGYIWSCAEPYHYLKNVPFKNLISSDKIRKNPLFFGPYKLVKLVRGQSTVWDRNPYYWQGQPHFAHVSMAVVSTNNATQAIKSHKFDVASVINDQYQQVKNVPGIHLIGDKDLGYSYLGFRVGHWDAKKGVNVEDAHAKMNNRKLRQAMLYAMNTDMINRRFYHNLRFSINSPILAQFGQYHDAKLPGYHYDLRKANRLLDQAGYKKAADGYRRQPNGRPLVINLAAHVSGTDFSIWQNYLQQWQKVGLRVKFLHGRPMEFNSWVESMQSNSAGIDIFTGGWALRSEPSPANLYGKNSFMNFSRFVSKKNQEYLNQIDSVKSFSNAYRRRAFDQWQKWMYKQAYIYPISSSYDLTAVNSKISHYSVRPSANNYFDAGFIK